MEPVTPAIVRTSGIPICIFAKPPLPEAVKTRLIPALGAAGAARLAAAMLSDVWYAVKSCPGTRPVLATTEPGVFPVPAAEADVWLQGDGDLGERIERILRLSLLESPVAVAIGADTPSLRAAHLQAALDYLETADAVLGPASDGGFYLLGLRRCPNGLLAGLPWSTSHTRQFLCSRLVEQSLSIAELEPLFDIDTPADLLALGRYFLERPQEQSATRAWWEQTSCEFPSLFRL